MPGWYDRIDELLRSKRLKALGVIQEQHPDRTLLFNQWKQLTMDLMVDPLNALDVSGVPIVLLVDQHGTIRFRNPSATDVQTFLKAEYAPTKTSPAQLPGGHLVQGDDLVLQGKLDEAIRYYRGELSRSPDDARLYFRLGVALRMRYDSHAGTEQDFADAVASWKAARNRDPNQYIWRRRIQQFGPVLDKPYPFYDWVDQARREIRERGEEPLPLTVEPRGAELAGPEQKSVEVAQTVQNPDPENKLHRDQAQMVHIQTLVVPSTESQQRAARVHLILTPQTLAGYAWNNEAEPLQVWISSDTSIQPNAQLLAFDNPPSATSEERRALEFEVEWPADYDPTVQPLKAYAVYNICNKQTGECTIRRQDFQVSWEATE